MGREIRRVPPNWQHPKIPCSHWPVCDNDECYQPQYDKAYDDAAKDWMKRYQKFLTKRPKHVEKDDYFWDWDEMPPQREYYRTYKDKDATWYQVYQTISEGSPVTPPFETQSELVEYLVNHGDFWRQKNKEGGFSRKAAESFVYGSGYAPSMVVSNGVLIEGIESCAVLEHINNTNQG